VNTENVALVSLKLLKERVDPFAVCERVLPAGIRSVPTALIDRHSDNGENFSALSSVALNTRSFREL
jgi:hypothetical protein